jgi:hypothetical protein
MPTRRSAAKSRARRDAKVDSGVIKLPGYPLNEAISPLLGAKGSEHVARVAKDVPLSWPAESIPDTDGITRAAFSGASALSTGSRELRATLLFYGGLG